MLQNAREYDLSDEKLRNRSDMTSAQDHAVFCKKLLIMLTSLK